MSYYDPIKKNTNDKIQKSYQDYINNYEKNKYLNLFSNIGVDGHGYVDPITKNINSKNKILIEDSIKQNPQNFFYRMQGGGHDCGDKKKKIIYYNSESESESEEDMEGMGFNSIRYGGASKRPVGGRVYNKKLVGGAIKTSYEGDPVNETVDKFSFGSMVGKALKYLLWDLPFKLQGKKSGSGLPLSMPKKQVYEKLSQMFGGALTTQQQKTVNDVMKQMKLNKESQKIKNQQKNDLKDEQMLEQKLNPLDKKEIARRKQLSGLTDKQKMTYMKMQQKKGKENYDAKVAEFDRLASVERRQNEEDDWRNTQKSDRQAAIDEKARLQRIADDKANKSFGSKLLDAGLDLIPEVAGLIPVKFLQGPAKALLKEGVAGLKSGLGRKPMSIKQKAHQNKIKLIMNKENCTFKEALSKLKNY